jgi:hypothetical protein
MVTEVAVQASLHLSECVSQPHKVVYNQNCEHSQSVFSIISLVKTIPEDWCSDAGIAV